MTIKELEQQVNNLKAEIEKLKNEKKQRELKPWRASQNTNYFYLDSMGGRHGKCWKQMREVMPADTFSATTIVQKN